MRSNKLVAIILGLLIGSVFYFRNEVYGFLFHVDPKFISSQVSYMPKNENDWFFALTYSTLIILLTLVFIFMCFGRKKYVRITGGIYMILFICILLLNFAASALKNNELTKISLYFYFVFQTPILAVLIFFYFWKLRPMKSSDKV